MIDELKEKGWYLSHAGIETCKDGINNATVSAVIRKALDTDLKEIGRSYLSDEFYKNKIDYVTGPCILQIQKVKNVNVPKSESTSSTHKDHTLLRVVVTDGVTTVSCLQWGYWKTISMDTPPGTKIFVKNNAKIPVQNGFLLLSENQFTLLGGHVLSLFEKWELSRSLASHVRRGDSSDDGPPPWIPFGKSINLRESKASANDFKSLEQESREPKDENASFKQQRQANIAEVTRAKEGKVKVFGGGKEKSSSGTVAVAATVVKPVENTSEKPSYRNNQSNYQKYQSASESPASRNATAVAQKPQNSYSSSNSNNNFYDSPKGDRDHHYKSNTSNRSDSYRKPDQDRYKKVNNKNNYTDDRKQYPGNAAENRNVFQGYEDSGRMSHERTNYGRGDDSSLNQRMSQMNVQDNRKAAVQPYMQQQNLKPGSEVLARYWEDKRFYPATIHAVGENGTCVVHFVEYGNYEEVRVGDIRPMSSNKNTFGDNSYRNSGNHLQSQFSENVQFTGVLEFRRGGNKPFVHKAGNEDYNQDRNRERQQRPPPRPYQSMPYHRQ